MEPLFLTPYFRPKIWGGRKLNTVLGYDMTVLYEGESYEITTFRTESGYQDFRRPDHVTFVQNLSEDLKRREVWSNRHFERKSSKYSHNWP